MSTKVPQSQEDQEIDLLQISKKINDFFQKINTSIFRGIQFFIKNKIVVLALVIIGFGLGMFLDKTQKNYEHQIIVAPNFESTDYLYAKVNLIDSKIKEGDTVFLKSTVGILHPKKFKSIEIEPIADIYKLIENKPENFELIKLMADNGDIKKTIDDNLTSKNYRYHKISVFTDSVVIDNEIMESLLNFFNKTEYFKKIQEANLINVKAKMVQNDTTISQINNVLKEFSTNVNGSQKSDKLVYYNENTQLNDVIKTKGDLVKEQGYHRLELIGYDKIIKDISTTLNIEKTGLFYGKKKLLLPLVFVFGYIFLSFFRAFYRKQKLIIENNN
ncbi:hypothetical protein SGQ83_13945 [Flavobacterium sp. Fl-318]|uniref:Polysaccharide chain length determinant N-terminal domain-containing protein n=1 Tax=Flavobacterium cupriresistens TaxID=2893885 RepID=A0ABU4RD21_9FLAO|nr:MULTISPECIES: hypothetical protein [unclassified Flavobacterium]MDX6190459.1 hypothetical protein [Flavobacterium sp. Fl-318]UFH43522.1 hypothetical protein LNP23_04715 [Flavobacterium sp. F-323]